MELGAGLSFTYLIYGESYSGISYDESMLYSFFRFGYRHQPYNGGLLFRIAFTPYMKVFDFIYENNDYSLFWFRPLFGISVGYTFKNKGNVSKKNN